MPPFVRRYPMIVAVGGVIIICAFWLAPESAAQSESAVASTLTCTTPVAAGNVPVPATTSQVKLAERLSVEPTQLDIWLFASEHTGTLTIRNDTSTPISQIDLSSTELVDPKTHRRIVPLRWNANLNVTLQTNQRTDCSFVVPVLLYAGSYAGILRVDAGQRESSVPFTLRTRGPILDSWYGLPLLLAAITALFGWAVSLLLDQWYTKGLPQAQLILTLREQMESIENFSRHVARWETANGVLLPNAVMIAAFDKSEVDSELKQANHLSTLELQQMATRMAIEIHLNDEFWTALQIAELKVPAASLGQTAQRLDGVPRATDVPTYRAALLQVLTTPPPAAALGAGAGNLPASKIGADLSGLSSSALRRRIVVMDYVKWLVLALIVLFSVYTVYYLPNPNFGTLQDYLALFIWALGLSTTGSQLVSSIHK